ncbi:LANO_0C01992g1_1 [Lachancea nothofagi CBS 11611]|uniref:LANO_0C01992g1_1 n=1 Tax=Lachancea nothofagi CBS 11611 TaxID=1266666 RepID=A0A1G4J4T5_9SACH|nr:LANO_0C01992g1_1 [Lachancea nothofagi CBS 11611]
MKFGRGKRKGSVKRAFRDGDDSSQDSDSDQGFEHYLKRKSSAIAGNVPKNGETVDLGTLDRNMEDRKVKPQSSKLIGKFMAAKNQREMDKLHQQSLKVELEGQKMGTSERYVTESYKGLKHEMDDASKAAAEEESTEAENFGGPSVQLQTFLMDKKEPDASEAHHLPSEEKVSQALTKKAPFKNDIYVVNHHAKTVEYNNPISLPKLPQYSRERLSVEFMSSNKTSEEIAKQRQLYLLRIGLES